MGSTIAIAAGGTGGHLFPAVATAEMLERLDPRVEIVFVGRNEGFEYEQMRNSRWDYIPVRVDRLGKGVPGLVRSAAQAMRATLRCRGVLKALRPDAVAGFGGFVAGPLLVAARTLGIPSAVHEANRLPGRTNRWLRNWVTTVCVSQDEGPFERVFRSYTVTGLPLRSGTVGHAPAHRALGLREGVPTVLVFGGSQGARNLCRAAAAAFRILADEGLAFQGIIQTGTHSYDETLAGGLPEGIRVTRFIEEMGAAYATADVAVARAGAGSIAEIAANGLPSILVPFPFATEDHQTVNARPLAEAGAAVLIADRDLDGASLSAALRELLTDAGRRAAMAEKARAFAKPDAAERLAAEILALARGNGRHPKHA